MQSSLIAKSLIFDNYSATALVVIDVLSILAAIAVIINKNPIISILYLIGLFLGVACHLMFSGLTFLGLSYLLVYIGAISILFLFILMLINIRISELRNETKNTLPLALLIIAIVTYALLPLFPTTLNNQVYNLFASNLGIDNLWNINTSKTSESIWLVSSNGWENSLTEVTNISALGDIMYTNYAIWLIITSIILLLSMVGAIVIIIKQPKNV